MMDADVVARILGWSKWMKTAGVARKLELRREVKTPSTVGAYVIPKGDAKRSRGGALSVRWWI
jgi:hypothetical protein